MNLSKCQREYALISIIILPSLSLSPSPHPVYSTGHTREPIRNVPTPSRDRERFCLTDEQVLEVADFVMKIEDHYSNLAVCKIIASPPQIPFQHSLSGALVAYGH